MHEPPEELGTTSKYVHLVLQHVINAIHDLYRLYHGQVILTNNTHAQ